MKALAIEVPHVRWDDIGGYQKVKKSLQECVEWPLKFASLFKQLKVSPPRGVLLYGPPGCSKTMMAKAVATESKMNFISVKVGSSRLLSSEIYYIYTQLFVLVVLSARYVPSLRTKASAGRCFDDRRSIRRFRSG